VCRCEEITAGTLRQVIELGATGPNQLKTLTRCGMGPCQGRLCGATITHLLSDTCNIRPKDLGDLRIRPPVKPIRLAEIAAMPYTPESVFAVTGIWPDE
jgi:bacterioferritin-associated ferredoxin